MQLSKVLIVCKRSTYSVNKARLNRDRQSLGLIFEKMKLSHHQQIQSLREVTRELKKFKIKFQLIYRDDLERFNEIEKKTDLVISIGGDGTFLETTHRLNRVPILGINADPQRSIGRFMAGTSKEFSMILRQLIQNKISILKLSRLQLIVNGQKIHPLVLNDVLIAPSSPAVTARYLIQLNQYGEEQMSSGIWISTAVGSTAAIFSAGGEKMNSLNTKFQFVVREIFKKKFGKRHLLSGIVDSSSRLKITSFMKNGCLFIDGPHNPIPFEWGDKLMVKISSHPIKVAGFKSI